MITEDAALDLTTVVLEGVVRVHRGGIGRRIRLAVADRAVDRVVFLDRLGCVPANPADAVALAWRCSRRASRTASRRKRIV